MSRVYTYCPKCFTKKLYRTGARFACAGKGCRYSHEIEGDAAAPQPTEKGLVAEVKKCERKIEHWKQWRNEPSAKKKLSTWRRRLKRAKTVAAELSIRLPEPPPPPPPPPTEEELAAAALKETQKRVMLPWFPQPKTTAWAPWGTSGWSAVVVSVVYHKWARVKRVNAKTGETVATGKARKDRLVKRDPALKGKDKPAQSPLEVFPDLDAAQVGQDDSDAVAALPASQAHKPVAAAQTPEEKKRRLQCVHKLLSTLDDDGTDDDW